MKGGREVGGNPFFAKRILQPQPRWPGMFRQRISRGAEKATGNPLLERSRFPAPPARTFILLAVYQGCVDIPRREDDPWQTDAISLIKLAA